MGCPLGARFCSDSELEIASESFFHAVWHSFTQDESTGDMGEAHDGSGYVSAGLLFEEDGDIWEPPEETLWGDVPPSVEQEMRKKVLARNMRLDHKGGWRTCACSAFAWSLRVSASVGSSEPIDFSWMAVALWCRESASSCLPCTT